MSIQKDNVQDLIGKGAVAKIRDIVEDAETCFFTTQNGSTEPRTRPMAAQKVDDAGSIWFLSSIDSHKNLEVGQNPSVELYFQGKKHAELLHLVGKAFINQDNAKIRELWDPAMKAWFTEGESDPRITVIEFRPEHGYYWDVKHSPFVAAMKMVVGSTSSNSVEGRIVL
jgi:general stress protein 26